MGTFMEPPWNLLGNLRGTFMENRRGIFMGTFVGLHGTPWRLHGDFMGLHGDFMGRGSLKTVLHVCEQLTSWNLHGTFMGIFVEPSWTLQGTFMGTFVEPSWETSMRVP